MATNACWTVTVPSGGASDLATTVDHEVGHCTLMCRLDVPVRHISIRPGSNAGDWAGQVTTCERSGDVAAEAQGQIAAAGPLAEGQQLIFPRSDPGGDCDEARLFRGARTLAEESGRPIEECWQQLVDDAEKVLNDTADERATVAARICAYLREREQGKRRFDEEGDVLKASMGCRHSDHADGNAGNAAKPR